MYSLFIKYKLNKIYYSTPLSKLKIDAFYQQLIEYSIHSSVSLHSKSKFSMRINRKLLYTFLLLLYTLTLKNCNSNSMYIQE